MISGDRRPERCCPSAGRADAARLAQYAELLAAARAAVAAADRGDADPAGWVRAVLEAQGSCPHPAHARTRSRPTPQRRCGARGDGPHDRRRLPGPDVGAALRSGEFPGRPESAGAARRWATRCLAGCPAAEDAGLCVTELVTNAVVHSRSQLPGGKVRVRLLIAAGVQVRIEVRDDGPVRDAPGAAADPADAAELAEDGRGLAIVQALSGGNAGSDGNGLHWVQLHWAPLPASLPPGPEPQAVPAVPAGSLELCASCRAGAGRAIRAAAVAVPQGGALFTAARGGAW